MMKSVAQTSAAKSQSETDTQTFLIGTSAWDRFARRDAFTYILTDLHRGDQRAFWNSGDKVVNEELLPAVREYRVSPGTAMEIGCGVGRLMFPLSFHFRRVFGLDISPEMVNLGQDMASEKNIRNSRFFCVTDPSRLDAEISGFAGNVDFIYSLLVFQHIDDFRVIAAYIQAISSLLSKDGMAYLQFDTRDQTALYRVKNALPDFVLPRFLRRGIRRIRRTPAELEDAFARSSLEAIDSISPNTEYHRYVLCRRDATS